MRLEDLLKVIVKSQSIKVYDYQNKSISFKGKSNELTDENILERKIKDVFTLYGEVDKDDESYLIITLY